MNVDLKNKKKRKSHTMLNPLEKRGNLFFKKDQDKNNVLAGTRPNSSFLDPPWATVFTPVDAEEEMGGRRGFPLTWSWSNV